MSKERVGLVGVGRMGYAMLKHMLKAGHDVTVTDLNAESVKKAVAEGAKSAATPAELAKVSDFVIIAVGFDDESKLVTTGPGGLLETLKPGSIIAISSTVSPKTSQELDDAARAKGSDVLDAPICRGGWSADQGTLLALFGGKEAIVERSKNVFSSFSSDIVHVGEVGHGQVAKTMNNMLLWVNAVALIEAGKLAQSTGIALPKLREALLMSSGSSDALKEWDNITFTWALKDMQIVSQMTDESGLSLPIVGAIRELVKDGRRIKASNPPDWTGKRG